MSPSKRAARRADPAVGRPGAEALPRPRALQRTSAPGRLAWLHTNVADARAIMGCADRAIEACWLILAALVPLYVDPLRARTELPKELLLELTVAMMALLWAVRYALARRGASPEPRAVPLYLLWAGGLFAALTLLSAMASPLPDVSLQGSYTRGGGAWAVVAYVALFLIVADRLRTTAQLARLLRVLLVASLPVCLYALAQALQLDPLGWGYRDVTRAFATMGNPPALAAYLGLLLPLTIWRLQDSSPAPGDQPRGSWLGPLAVGAALAVLVLLFAAAAGRPQAWWLAPGLLATFALVVAVAPPFPLGGSGPFWRWAAYGTLVVLQSLTLVLTAARGPLVGVIVAALLVFTMTAWATRRWRLLLGGTGVLALLLGALVVLNAPGSPLRPLADSVPLVHRLTTLTSGYTQGRVLVWRAGLAGFATSASTDRDAPAGGSLRWLLGYGPETVGYQLNRVLPPAWMLDDRVGEFWDRSHNELVDQLLTTGICGVVAYVALIGGVLVVTLRRALTGPRTRAQRFAQAVAVALMGYVIAAQVGLTGSAAAIFWLLAGVAASGAWPAPAADPGPTESRPRVTARGPLASAVAQAPPWELSLGVVSGYGALLGVGALGLLAAPAPGYMLLATLLALVAFGVAPFVGAVALGKAASGKQRLAVAAALAAVAIPLTFAVGQQQVAALAADAAYHRALLAEQQSDFVTAIRATQDSIALTPHQAEYYNLLGQYYAALAPRASGPDQADFAADVTTAVSARQPTAFSRDQLFALGEASVRGAIALDPLEAKYPAALGEVYRYWDETAGSTAHVPAALEAFQAAIRLKPNDVEMHAGSADVLLLAGDYAGAAKRAAEARTLLADYWYPYAIMARAYMGLQQYPEAAAAADDALRYGAWEGRGWKGLGKTEASRLEALRQAALERAQGGPPA